MKNKSLFLAILILVLLMNCTSYKNGYPHPKVRQEKVENTSFKKGLVQSGGQQEAIKNAILDFSNTTSFYKKGTIFSLLIDYHGGDYPNKELLSVSIIESNLKMLLTKETKVGSKGRLPSRFIEREGKLFYWSDNDYSLTKKMLIVLEKYHLLQDDESGRITIPDLSGYISEKGVHYYFCKNNLTKYKKVITSFAIGYYKPPKLKCE